MGEPGGVDAAMRQPGFDHLSGGYVFVRRAARPAYPGSSALPESIWTPTSCICGLYPGYWALLWSQVGLRDVDTALAQLGLGRGDLRPLQQWAQHQFESGGIGVPGTLLRYDVAVEFAARFVRGAPDIKLLGIGLPEAYAAEFLSEARPRPQEGAHGVYQAIQAGAPLAEGGTILGYEPLGYDSGDFHSFLCNSLEKHYVGELGLSLNEHGRFCDRCACERAVAYTRVDSTGAEPALWQPWLVVEYPRAPS